MARDDPAAGRGRGGAEVSDTAVSILTIAAVFCAYMAGYTHHQIMTTCRRLRALDRARARGFEDTSWWDGFFDSFAWTDDKEPKP